MSGLYFEDMAVGRKFGGDSYVMDAETIKDFAGQWDPQFFHTDAAAAEDSFFNGLAASGWHTLCATMRLLITGDFKPVNGVVGAGVTDLKWHRPVRPGDVLTIEAEVTETRLMRSKPGFGLVHLRVTTLDAAGQPVQAFSSPLVVQTRG